MSQLDAQALEQVREWALKRLEEEDRRRRLAPLMGAFQQSMQQLMTQVVPDLTADPTANTRKAVLALEKSLEEQPAKLREAEAEVERVLESARLRTASLERWLEELS